MTKKADGKVKTSTVKKKNENKTAQWHPLLPFLTLTPTKTLPPTVHPICFVLIFDSASPSSFCCPINNHCYIRYDVMLGIYPGSFPGLQTSKSTEIEKHVRKRTSEQSRSRKKKRKREPYLQPFKQQALNHYSNSKLAFAKKNKFLILLKKKVFFTDRESRGHFRDPSQTVCQNRYGLYSSPERPATRAEEGLDRR